MGYKVKSVEDDKLGWDLECTKGDETKYVEVKGLSGETCAFELTPNEYEKLRKEENYLIYVLTNALKKNPTVHILEYNNSEKYLIDKISKKRYEIEEKIGARIN